LSTAGFFLEPVALALAFDPLALSLDFDRLAFASSFALDFWALFFDFDLAESLLFDRLLFDWLPFLYEFRAD